MLVSAVDMSSGRTAELGAGVEKGYSHLGLAWSVPLLICPERERVACHVEGEGGHARWDAKEETVTNLGRAEQSKPSHRAIGDRDEWNS